MTVKSPITNVAVGGVVGIAGLDDVGDVEGLADGVCVGGMIGLAVVGDAVGAIVGFVDVGNAEGLRVGELVEGIIGLAVVGDEEELTDGDAVGETVEGVGMELGVADGCAN